MRRMVVVRILCERTLIDEEAWINMACPNCGGELHWETNKHGFKYYRCENEECGHTYGADEVSDDD